MPVRQARICAAANALLKLARWRFVFGCTGNCSLDYLDPGYATNGNLTISSHNKINDSDATSDFSTLHR